MTAHQDGQGWAADGGCPACGRDIDRLGGNPDCEVCAAEPQTIGYDRGDGCQHPQIADAALVEREALIARTWGDADPLKCPDCDEYLYPSGDPADGPDDARIYVGEPKGAGDDIWGRPSPITHPEFWTE